MLTIKDIAPQKQQESMHHYTTHREKYMARNLSIIKTKQIKTTVNHFSKLVEDITL